MTKRVAVVTLASLGSLLGLILVFAHTNPEPTYQSRSLSSWFKRYCRDCLYPSAPGSEPDAQEALRAMGTNAVPWLLAQCFSTNVDSAFETNVFAALNKVPLFPPFIPAEDKRWSAVAAIGQIKPPVAMVLPRVAEVLKSADKNQQAAAMCVLHGVGDGAEAAVPLLCEKLRGSDLFLQRRAVHSLERLGPAAKGALPDLLKILDAWLRRRNYAICEILGNCGADAAAAIPALKAHMATETNLLDRIEVGIALCRIDANESQVLDVLMEQIRQQKSSDARANYIYQLGKIGPNARAAAPFLQELLEDPKQQAWLAAAKALLGSGETNLMVDGVLKRLEAPLLGPRFEAVKMILAVQPTNTLAWAALAPVMRDPTLGYSAIDEAARQGPAAAPAIPVLREIEKGKYPSPQRQAARRALCQIEQAGHTNSAAR